MFSKISFKLFSISQHTHVKKMPPPPHTPFHFPVRMKWDKMMMVFFSSFFIVKRKTKKKNFLLFFFFEFKIQGYGYRVIILIITFFSCVYHLQVIGPGAEYCQKKIGRRADF